MWGFDDAETATPPPVFERFGRDLMDWDDLDAETKYQWRALERQSGHFGSGPRTARSSPGLTSTRRPCLGATDFVALTRR